MTGTIALTNLGNIANALFNSVTANSTAITALSVGGATVNSSAFAGTANNTSFVGTVSAANVVSNAQLTANLANYQTTAGLSAVVATLSSNNSTNLNGQAASFYTNASNLSTGTLPDARLSSAVVNTSGAFTISGTRTFSANVTLNGALIANSSPGTANQILFSNGTSIFWANSSTTVRQTYTATAGQTTFAVSGGYTPNQIDVYYNGVKLINGTEVTVNGGSNIVLASGAANGATVDVVGVNMTSLTFANAVAKTGDTMSGTLNLPSGGLTVGTTDLVVAGSNVGIGTATPGVRLDVSGGVRSNSLIVATTDLVVSSGSVGIGTASPTTRLEVNGGIRASINNSPGGTTSFVLTRLDGSSAALAAPNAVYLQQVCGITTNGVYWINLPTAGPTQIFCILDPACAGGGWMMAIKGTRGTTFPYTSTHWTTVSTVNPSETNRNDGDAKFHTYNYFSARDWLAIWPDLSNGGDVSGGYGGWVWVENNATGNQETVLTFMNRGVQVTKASNGVIYSRTDPVPTSLPKYGNLWSMSGGFQWYGLNYTGNTGARVRWGWATNNENEQNSNDINGGIGMTYNSFSAGDSIACCQVITGINRSARFEWYVR